MPIYRIADLNVGIKPKYKQTIKILDDYRCIEENADFEISLSYDEISDYCNKSNVPCSESDAESILILIQICNRVLSDYNGFFFHSSSLMLDGEAYVFTAKSGTGKSTHTALWREYFGNRVTMINDDKPIIRKTEYGFKVYGTPWMGKANIGTNTNAPVKAVYILRRGAENSAVRASVGEVFREILEATLIPTEKDAMSGLLNLLDEFFSNVPVYILNCNTQMDSVITAYNVANSEN